MKPEEMKQKVEEAVRLLNQVNDELSNIETEETLLFGDDVDVDQALDTIVSTVKEAVMLKGSSVQFSQTRPMRREYLSVSSESKLRPFGPVTLTLEVVYDPTRKREKKSGL